jgi:hypothetical protein
MFNIGMPTSVEHLFNNWANGVGPQFKKLLLVGAASLCWAMWTSMTWCLIILWLKLICRYFTDERSGFGNGGNFKGMRSLQPQ